MSGIIKKSGITGNFEISKQTSMNALIVASMLALSMNAAYAEDIAPELQKTEDANKDVISDETSSKAEKIYTLTKLQTGGEKPVGDNIITKFDYDKLTGNLVPVYYRLDLTKTTYGEGDSVKYYGWTKDANGNKILTDIEQQNADITFKYSGENLKNNISNNDKIDSIEGTFKEQSIAIENHGTIDNIKGDFIANTITSGNCYGGSAIKNYSDITSISGNFVNNYGAYYGVINNIGGNIGDISGTFIKNKITEYPFAEGGAITNSGKIDSINGIFIDNSTETHSINSVATGGAIDNSGDIGNITGTFIANNSISSEKRAMAKGGAIYNNGTIDNITGDFIGNYTYLADNEENSSIFAAGGAIYNSNVINSITGDFIGNSAKSSGNEAIGGAIALETRDKVENITGDFIGNSVHSDNTFAKGGAIYLRDGGASEINSNFIGNQATSLKSSAYGGAINNFSFASIGNITGDFINNKVSGIDASGGAIYNISSSGGKVSIDNIKGDFIANSAVSDQGTASGGAIFTGINRYFDNYYGYISNLSGDFVQNTAKGYSNAKGGAIANISNSFEQEITIDNIVNSNFIGNNAVSTNGNAKGGAIYTANPMLMTSKDGYTSVISGNYVEDKNGKRPEAIYVDEKAKFTFDAKTNGKFVINDKINGLDGYTVSLKGDETGTVYLNNNIESIDYSTGTKGTVNVNLSDIMLNLGKDSVLDSNNLTLNSGTINMVNNQVGVSSLNNLTLGGDTNMVADVDLAKGEMDRFTANSYGKEAPAPARLSENGLHKGNLHVVGFNMLSDASEDQDVTEIYFAQVGLKDNVVNGVNATPTSYQTTAYTPIYKYNVKYDNREDGGYFLFTKGDNVFTPGGGTEGTGNPSDAYNPSVLSSPVAAQAGAYAAQNAAFSYAFQHADGFMPLPLSERFAIRNANRYAINETPSFSTRLNDFHDKAIWVRPYTSFENIPLKNGPKVDTITYGTLVGGDSQIKELRNGWGTVFTGYVGYNGSSQSYSGVNTYQNGGLLGATQTFYKKNFFTALTASVGASAGESHNMYGHENFSMLMAGLASKTGYNIEFKEGKYILQPSLLMSYSFINTFDYRNSAGVKINSDPLHAIQIHPNIRFISNLKNGWQPYASVGMVWNILDDTKVMANDVRLPEMSVKPYVEYGLGVQKRWQDKFTGFAQAMVRNGGRNGIALSAGFRWALGKEGKPIEKVQTKNDKTAQITETTGGRKILKQLSQEQRTALGAKPQNTTRTTNIGVLKQL